MNTIKHTLKEPEVITFKDLGVDELFVFAGMLYVKTLPVTDTGSVGAGPKFDSFCISTLKHMNLEEMGDATKPVIRVKIENIEINKI